MGKSKSTNLTKDNVEMKINIGMPVVVIRNRDSNVSEKYRVRNLLTNTIAFTDDITLLNPVMIPNVDDLKNLGPERLIKCNWALVGSVALPDDVSKLTNKTKVETDMYGITFPSVAKGEYDTQYYYEEHRGPLKALRFTENASERFVWLKRPFSDND